MTRRLTVRAETWPLAGVFRISRGARSEAEVLVVEIHDGAARGWAECVPYARYGETMDSVRAQITAVAPAIANGLGRTALAAHLPPGAARNAVDCALWDLAAKQTGTAAWHQAEIAAPVPLTTVFTLGVDTPEAMAAAAAANATRPILKLKMTGDGADIDRVAAIHASAPAARLVVDANEGWDLTTYLDLAPRLAELGVEMIEQPLPAGADDPLAGAPRPVTLCADESCHDRASLPGLAAKYDMINIKLDKTGGLTEALALRDAALAEGLAIMVGCMVGTSLAMAPACLVAQGAAIVDLDGPLLLKEDRQPGLVFDGSQVTPPAAELWG